MFNALAAQLAPVKNLPCPWYVAGGWSINLFLNQLSRPHGDVDICVFRQDQTILQNSLLADGWVLYYIADKTEQTWQAGQLLKPPVHEVWARRGDAALEFLLNERDGNMWVSRRDASVRVPLREAILVHTETGFCYLAPHISLYFKAKQARPKDTDDFTACWPRLTPTQQNWLRQQLGDHAWLAAA